MKRASGSEAQRVGADAADPVTNVCLDGKAADRMRRVGAWKLGQGPWHSHRHAPTAWVAHKALSLACMSPIAAQRRLPMPSGSTTKVISAVIIATPAMPAQDDA